MRNVIHLRAVVAVIVAVTPVLRADPPPAACGDANGDGMINIADAQYLLNWLFLGGRAPRCNPAVEGDEIAGFELLAPNDQGYLEYRHERTGIVFVRLPGGTFQMGSPPGEIGRGGDELLHETAVTSFLIAKYEVTQAQWTGLMGSNPSTHTGDGNRPVETVRWLECKDFCNRFGLRLPTEAEWEYACRAGTDGPFGGTGDLDEMGWYFGNSGDATHPVGTKAPNGFGLHDTHGNVEEWCEDFHDVIFYRYAAARWTNPISTSGNFEGVRVVRGGSYRGVMNFCRSARRSGEVERSPRDDRGFRPVFPLYPPFGCADVNGSGGRPEISDPQYILNWLFLGGPPPLCASAEVEGFTFTRVNEQGHREYFHDATSIIFVLVPGGTFPMGSPTDEPWRQSDEGDTGPHQVTVSSFLIAKTEVTQKEWLDFPEEPPEGGFRFPGDRRPAENVSWFDAKEFCNRAGLRLPTEAEWEYACRAGTDGPFSGTGDLDEMGWYSGNSGNATHPVGTKAPNAFGLEDMHGNVWEWCEDVYDGGFYELPQAMWTDPLSTAGSEGRVIRGGSWIVDAQSCRSAYRGGDDPSGRGDVIGFRPARPLR